MSESSLTSEDKILSMTPGLAEKAIIQDSLQNWSLLEGNVGELRHGTLEYQ